MLESSRSQKIEQKITLLQLHPQTESGHSTDESSGLRCHLFQLLAPSNHNSHYMGSELLVNQLVELAKKFGFLECPSRTRAPSVGKETTLHLSGPSAVRSVLSPSGDVSYAKLSSQLDTRFFGHPRGLATLFFTEMWERFSYYGMRAILILFMTAGVAQGGLGFDVAKAAAIYGLYTAGVYLSGLPGGWLADRVFGHHRAVLFGGVLIAAGHCTLAVHKLHFFYSGLILVVVGTGLLKPNISALVGQLYSPQDTRRDAGFSIFYMGINTGSFIAPLACGYVGQRINWHLGFGLAALGMTAGIAQFCLGTKNLWNTGARSQQSPSEFLRRWTAIGAGIIAFAAILLYRPGALTSAESISNLFGIALLAAVTVLLAWLSFFGKWTPAERRRLIVVSVLLVSSMLFWSAFEQAGSTLNLFAERNTDKNVLGFPFPASWLQSLGALFVILLAPVFAWLWMRLGVRNPSASGKFVLGLVFAGLGFSVLAVGAARSATHGLVSPGWLVTTYLLNAIGELCLSPVGLSAITKMSPPRIVGLMMGFWFLFTAAGNYLGGRFASLYESVPLPRLLGSVTLSCLTGALLLAGFTRFFRKRLQGDTA